MQKADLDASATKAGAPRVGFLGLGWIGLHRMEHMVRTGAINPVALVDPSDAAVSAASAMAGSAARVDDLDALLEQKLDGIVIATPSALHADQAIKALNSGAAVFCQKPLGRTGSETQAVIDAARSAGRLLSVDLSYRFMEGSQLIRELVRQGALGRVHTIDLTFHNAYGPDKSWFYDPSLSGGGCVVDLGVHLVDLALWILDTDKIEVVSSDLFAKGERISGRELAEDAAFATLRVRNGPLIRLACSWKLPVGQDAVIAADLYGTHCGAVMRNVNGSFYDFITERLDGTSRVCLASYPDQWGGRAAAEWAQRLSNDRSFDPSVGSLAQVANLIDDIYAKAFQGRDKIFD